MQVTIGRLGHLGDGIAEGPVFVPRTLPGEVVEGEIVNDTMPNPRILKASPHRIAAPCRHYKSCGGCNLQHASSEFVSEWKRHCVEKALLARGLAVAPRALHVSPPSSRRRATLSGHRTKKGAIVGFHRARSKEVLQVEDCRILLPEILAAVPALAEITSIGASRKAELKFSLTTTETGLDISVVGGKPTTLDLYGALVDISQRHGFARITWDGDVIAVNREPSITIGKTVTSPPPGAFLQATRAGEQALQSAVLEIVRGTDGPVVDLFSGLGTFSLVIAETHETHAVEAEDALLTALDKAWRRGDSLRKVTHESRDLFRRPLLADELSRFAAIVIDPPRAGAEAQTLEIARSGVGRVAFVSCNPATFARDAEILTRHGYKLDWLDVVDQFLWSSHIELVAQFSLD